MKFKDYINEKVEDFKTLRNMVSVVSHKKDLDYIIDVVEKSLKNKLINDKEYKKLQQEIKSLKKSIKIWNLKNT